MIFESQKVIFIHINKTGGGSIEKALLREFTPEKIHWDDENEFGYGNHQDLKKHISQGVDLDKYFKFSIIRNPWDKMVSLYYFRKQGGTKGKTKNGTDVCNFNEWVDSIDEFRQDRRGHTNQYDWLSDFEGKIRIDFTMKFETIESDWAKVANILKLKHAKLPHIHKAKLRNNSDYRDYYKQLNGDYDYEFIEKVARLFSKDIDYFGYIFD